MNDVPHTVRALREFWRRHLVALAAVRAPLYDELDALVRQDERRIIAETGGVEALAARYNDVVGENVRLTRQLASRHVLGTCPHCEHPERPRPVPLVVFGLAFALSGAIAATIICALIRAGVALWG